MTDAPLTAVITCPHCATRRAEQMPRDGCLFFYECTGCGVILRPLPGDCCVFCSYADRRCPTATSGSDTEGTAGS